MNYTLSKRSLGAAALTITLAAACVEGTSGGPGPSETIPPTDNGPTTWDPAGGVEECNSDTLLAPSAYASKVKSLLNGLPLTSAEFNNLDNDPGALGDLIDSWLDTPQGDLVLRRFFMNAFQQTSLDRESFRYLLNRNANTGRFENPRSARIHDLLNENMRESFARTAVEMVRQGRPFNDVITTNKFQMTTAMMVFLAYLDDEQVGDDGEITHRNSVGDFRQFSIHRDTDTLPANLADTVDPGSSSFLHFYHGRMAVVDDEDPECQVAAVNSVTTSSAFVGDWYLTTATPPTFVFAAIMGQHLRLRRTDRPSCFTGRTVGVPLLDRSDFSDWREVEIRKPIDQKPTKFYNLKNLRSIGDGHGALVLRTHRRGFYSTPAFHSTWQNNEDNAARVTINQILIVALGQSFDGATSTNFDPAMPGEHVDKPECASCHEFLDPMRLFVQNTYTNFYGEQWQPKDEQPEFDFGDVYATGNDLDDLGAVLADHPAFPYGWVQKLCYFANSEACPKGPELDRVASAFVDSNYNFRTLVRELFSSPLVTGSHCVDGVDSGTEATIARKGQFCHQLSVRLNKPDLCSIDTLGEDADPLQESVAEAVASVPDDSFSRAEVAPVTIAETGLFTRANREAACIAMAEDGFDELFGDVTWNTLLDRLVEDVMGLPEGDPRHNAAREILQGHGSHAVTLNNANDEQLTEKEVMQSVFVLACMSPRSAGVGF